MGILTTGIFICIGLYIVDRIFLKMEQMGWVYYRYKKPSATGGLGNALQEMNATLVPSVRHVMEMKEKDVKIRDDQGDNPIDDQNFVNQCS